MYPRWGLVRDVAEVAAELEEKGDLLAANLLKQEERWSNARANAADAHAGAVVTVWQELYELLMKYADGLRRQPRPSSAAAWWLTEVRLPALRSRGHADGRAERAVREKWLHAVYNLQGQWGLYRSARAIRTGVLAGVPARTCTAAACHAGGPRASFMFASFVASRMPSIHTATGKRGMGWFDGAVDDADAVQIRTRQQPNELDARARIRLSVCGHLRVEDEAG